VISRENVNALDRLLRESGSTVFFGGAGTSTRSGIPDFRSLDGGFEVLGRPAVADFSSLLSLTCLREDPEAFWDFFRTYLAYPDARPNRTHRALAELERQGLLSCVVTLNMDGLHQAAGSTNVVEAHGSVHRHHCVRCGRTYGLDLVFAEAVPHCPVCGGAVRPDGALFEEPLDEADVVAAVGAISTADVLVVGGTTLGVYPAAGMVSAFRGSDLVIVNLEPTAMDSRASLVVRGELGAVLGEVAGVE